jgi:hypothetical protein
VFLPGDTGEYRCQVDWQFDESVVRSLSTSIFSGLVQYYKKMIASQSCARNAPDVTTR